MLSLFSGSSLPFRSGNGGNPPNYSSLPNNSSKKQETLLKRTPIMLRLVRFSISTVRFQHSHACFQEAPRKPLEPTAASLQGRPGERKQDGHLTCHFPPPGVSAGPEPEATEFFSLECLRDRNGGGGGRWEHLNQSQQEIQHRHFTFRARSARTFGVSARRS